MNAAKDPECGGCGATTPPESGVIAAGKKTAAPKRCGQCRKTRYCSVACQERDWARHKLVCRSAAASQFLHLLEHKRSGLLDFLGRGNHGNRDVLMSLFSQIEVTTTDPIAIRRWSIHPSKVDSIFEWPTDELCHCISAIMTFEQCDRIVELGAGTGLLAHRFNRWSNHHSSSPHQSSSPQQQQSHNGAKVIVATTPISDPAFKFTVFGSGGGNDSKDGKENGKENSVGSRATMSGLFGEVFDGSCQSFSEKSTPVLIAWLDEVGHMHLPAMIKRNAPRFILGLSMPCATADREQKKSDYIAGNRDYSVTYITPKTFCYKDRGPTHGTVAGGKDCRSMLTYFRLKQPPLTAEQVVALCGASNLGSCASMDDTTHQRLRDQDYQLNVKHDPLCKLACSNPNCHGCSYSP